MVEVFAEVVDDEPEPPSTARLYDYEEMPVSRLDPGPDRYPEVLVWTPTPKPASPTTALHTILYGTLIERDGFERLRASHGRAA